MKRQKFYIDYPQEHQGEALHAYQCKHCKIDTVKINGLLENHLPDCVYRIEKEKTITEYVLDQLKRHQSRPLNRPACFLQSV